MSVHDDIDIANADSWGQSGWLVRGPAIVRLKELKLRQNTSPGTTTAVDVYLARGTKTGVFAAVPTAEESAVIALAHVPTASATVSSLVDASNAGHEIRLRDKDDYVFLVIKRTTTGRFHARVVLELS